MKYAIISDIHSNYAAFEAVLDDISDKDVDGFIFVGDYIMDFPYPNETVDRIRSLKNAYVIKGNKEGYLENIKRNKKNLWKYDQHKTLYWTFEKLTDENIEYLISLPKQVEIDLSNGQKGLIIHRLDDVLKPTDVKIRGHQYKKMMEKKPFTHKEYLNYIKKSLLKDKIFMENLVASPYDIIISGHNHIQWYADLNGKLIINPGSCGAPTDFRNGAPYTIIEHTDKWIVTEHRVAYDVDKAIDDIMNTELYEISKVWTKLVITALKSSKETLRDYFIHLEKTANNFGEHGNPYSNYVWKRAYETGEKYFAKDLWNKEDII